VLYTYYYNLIATTKSDIAQQQKLRSELRSQLQKYNESFERQVCICWKHFERF